MSTFHDTYFKAHVEYPDPVFDFEEDTHLEYVSSSFLSGWINYVKPIACMVEIGYYRPDDQRRDPDEPTCTELYETFLTGKHPHTDLGDLGERVFVLGRAEGRYGDRIPGQYWYFCFDPDVSDCEIGFFKTDDAEDLVVERFKADRYGHDRREVPVQLLKGWISF